MFKKLHEVREEGLTVVVDGEPVSAEAGESVAAVLLRLDPLWSRTTPVSEERRAPYCMMGVCFECLALVDGASVQTCLVPVKDGMHVHRQLGRRRIAS
ncbi:(2Fe-2S)-binding protein [Rhizobium rhizogenes]|uniref:(2Fe-2S)-binding protein n=1 Tax=Rhizobium rhizogenes TaxID=359 RepID=UPI0015746C4B|nr:(2Fe-2S)-binding protein [Rhizobium rhizogenes]NTH68566.1 (2Fe-2S)-binding protein [Rhizobium rhizogenes]NTI39705.1 (2Fe-2S)-binding protein [Rhizobium rhizogenes]WEO69926.1 (2Fe-2S)-binding protein [Rhizobium rhizogenes]